MQKGILTHGAALNICNDWITAFKDIKPCGFHDLLVTSMKEEGFCRDFEPVLRHWGKYFIKSYIKNTNPIV